MNNPPLNPNSQIPPLKESIDKFVEETKFKEQGELTWGLLLRKFIACNPFYLVSAVALLWGIYRLSIDPLFLTGDLMQLVFSFGSLQVYGLLATFVSIFLARRFVWYDSILLFWLENLLALVPFILLSHAVFLGEKLSWGLTLLATGMLVAKFSCLKLFLRGFVIPRELLGTGLVILFCNAAFPLIFRNGLENDNEAWVGANNFIWKILLPLLVVFANILPRQSHASAANPHARPWLPFVAHLLWISATGVHLWSIAYVDDQNFQGGWIAVSVWAFAWTLCNRIDDFIEQPSAEARGWLFLAPVATTFFGLIADQATFFTLSLLNALIQGIIFVMRREVRSFAVLAVFSILVGVAGVPAEWVSSTGFKFHRIQGIFLATIVAGFIYASVSRTAKGSLAGAISTVFLISGLLWDTGLDPLNLAFQFGCIFFLLHSMSWRKGDERGASFLLGTVCLSWIVLATSYQLSLTEGKSLHLICAGSAVMLGCFLAWRLNRVLPKPQLFVGAAVTLVPPVVMAVQTVSSAPAGLLAVGGSFLLFALGTAFALARKHLAFLAPEEAQSNKPAADPLG